MGEMVSSTPGAIVKTGSGDCGDNTIEGNGGKTSMDVMKPRDGFGGDETGETVGWLTTGECAEFSGRNAAGEGGLTAGGAEFAGSEAGGLIAGGFTTGEF